jgi:hypothetical protein
MADDLKQGLGLDEALPIIKSMASEETRKKSESNKAAEAQILSQEGLYSKPAPDFKPSEESASGFAALGALLAASGAILGSGGRSSGLMAMNAVSGMMNGYNAGRKDLYEQERQKFEESMKSWEKNRALIKDAFDRAMKIAPTNLKLAQESLNRDLISLGQKPLAEMVQRSGPMPAAAAFYKANDNTTTKLSQLSSVLGTAVSGLTPAQKQHFDSLTTNQARVQFLEDVAAQQKASIGTGAAEYGTITYKDGTQKTGLFPASKIYEAEDKGGSFTKLAAPTATQAVDPVTKVGQGIGDVLQAQTPEAQDAALKSIRRFGVVAKDETIIPTEYAAIRQADRTAKAVAENRDAVGVLGTIAAKVGEPTSSIMASFKSIFNSTTLSENDKISNAGEVLNKKVNQIDAALDEYAKANPSQADVVRRAKLLGKELFSLALADAVAVGRPTVFLERALSSFYSPNVRPETLIDIIKSRAVDGNERLPKAFRNDTWQTPSKLLQTDSAEDFIKAVTGQQQKPSVTPSVTTGLNELSSVQKTGIQARIDQVNKDTSLTAANKKDLKDKIKKQIADGKFSDSGLNWGD